MYKSFSRQHLDLCLHSFATVDVVHFTQILLCGKAVAAGLSGSLSVITSVIDSAVDVVSGILMWWSSRAMKKRNPYCYPQGILLTALSHDAKALSCNLQCSQYYLMMNENHYYSYFALSTLTVIKH